MKTMTIEWNSLYNNGEFPMEAVEKCGLSVNVEKITTFKQNITISSNTDEEISLELAFHIGCLVTSHVFVN